jgi:hypothetical protein
LAKATTGKSKNVAGCKKAVAPLSRLSIIVIERRDGNGFMKE